MAQTTDYLSGVATKVEISTDGGSAWSDISGSSNVVTPSPQSRMSGEAYTFDGDTALVGFGKREPMDVEV